VKKTESGTCNKKTEYEKKEKKKKKKKEKKNQANRKYDSQKLIN